MSPYMWEQAEQAEQGARALIALSGAGVIVWAFVRWPLAVLVKAAALAAVRAALRDEDARASFARLVREQLIKGEVERLTRGVETIERLELRVAQLESRRRSHPPRPSSRRSA